MPGPKVFVSYSHDTKEHKDWVRRLSEDLVIKGVDVTLDQWDLIPGQDIAAFMSKGIRESQHVLLVCSETYVRKAEARIGGVGYEQLIVTGEVVANLDTKKFVPLIRANPGQARIPSYLGARLYIDFNHDDAYTAKREELLRVIHAAPENVKPPIGANPFANKTAAPVAAADRAIESPEAESEGLSNAAKANILFRRKGQWLDGQISAKERVLKELRTGTRQWKDVDAELQSLAAQKARISEALERSIAVAKEASGGT